MPASMELQGERVLLTGAAGGARRSDRAGTRGAGRRAGPQRPSRRAAGRAGASSAPDRGMRPRGPRRARAAGVRGGRRRRAGRQRRPARLGQSPAHGAGGDRPGAWRSTCARRSCSRAASCPPWSSVATVSSCSSRRSPASPSAGESSIYTATKFGLRGFAHVLRAQLRRKGVGVSLVTRGRSAMPACSRAAAARRRRSSGLLAGGRRQGSRARDRAQRRGGGCRVAGPAPDREGWRARAGDDRGPLEVPPTRRS